MIAPGMAGDIIFCQFSRSKVERGYFKPALGDDPRQAFASCAELLAE
jgi:hypothetical protein